MSRVVQKKIPTFKIRACPKVTGLNVIASDRRERGNLAGIKVEIAQPVPSKAKESSALPAMTAK